MTTGNNTTWILCTGMRRSASAWQFKTVCDFLPFSYNLGFIAHTEFSYYFKKLDSVEQCVIVKSHAFLPNYSNHFEELAKENRIVLVTSIRDIRDVCSSLYKKWLDWGHPRDNQNLERTVAAVINETNSWRSFGSNFGKRVVMQRYEEIVEDYCLATIEIRNALQFSGLSPLDKIEEICNGNLPENMKNEEIRYGESGRIWWHHNHMNDGNVGQWKTELRQDQIDVIESSGGKKWLEENNYVE